MRMRMLVRMAARLRAVGLRAAAQRRRGGGGARALGGQIACCRGLQPSLC